MKGAAVFSMYLLFHHPPSPFPCQHTAHQFSIRADGAGGYPDFVTMFPTEPHTPQHPAMSIPFPAVCLSVHSFFGRPLSLTLKAATILSFPLISSQHRALLHLP